MQKRFPFFTLAMFVLSFTIFHPAQGVAQDPGIQTEAKSGILLEVSTGATLFEQNADEPIEPASFTKVLTLYLVFEGLEKGVIHLNDDVWISERAWRTGGSKMFVGVDTKIPLEELIKGVAVVSGNDACIALAEHMYGNVDAFVGAMNQKAAELGMKSSRFMNPHGLPAQGQITTARDMATLAVAYLQRFPGSLRYHSMREYQYNDINQHNRNRLLLKDPSVDGLKTGFVAAAGYHLTATAQRDNMRLLAVVMGATGPSAREREALKLLNHGFRQYTLVQAFPPNQPAKTAKVWKGVKDTLDLYPSEAPSFLILQTQKNALRWEVDAPSDVTAPVTVRQAFGRLTFFLSDEQKKTVDLVSREDIERAGLFKRTWHSLLRLPKVKIDWLWFSYVSGGIFFAVVLIFLVSRRRSSRRSRTSFTR